VKELYTVWSHVEHEEPVLISVCSNLDKAERLKVQLKRENVNKNFWWEVYVLDMGPDGEELE